MAEQVCKQNIPLPKDACSVDCPNCGMTLVHKRPTPLPAEPGPEAAPKLVLIDEQIKYMADRFLGWKLPENFNPDGGVRFQKTFNEHTPWPMRHEPTGTNLFDAIQAEAMVRYMVEGMVFAEPSPEPEAAPTERCPACKGSGTEADYVGLEMRCVEVECVECKGSGLKRVAEPQQASAEPRDKWSDYLHALTLSYPQNPTAIAVAKEVRSMHVAQLAALKQSLGQCVEALKRFSRPDDCGDHCGNSCPQCQASKALAAAAELTEAR